MADTDKVERIMVSTWIRPEIHRAIKIISAARACKDYEVFEAALLAYLPKQKVPDIMEALAASCGLK